jgi:hypothetical protein
VRMAVPAALAGCAPSGSRCCEGDGYCPALQNCVTLNGVKGCCTNLNSEGGEGTSTPPPAMSTPPTTITDIARGRSLIFRNRQIGRPSFYADWGKAVDRGQIVDGRQIRDGRQVVGGESGSMVSISCFKI